MPRKQDVARFREHGHRFVYIFLMKHALSLDIEDWFHIVEIKAVEDPDLWPRLSAESSLVERYTDLILKICDEGKARATFFILGWIADGHPTLIKTHLETLIETIRSPSWLNDPMQKFILCTDPYRAGGSTIHNAHFDQYAGVLAELALADDFIMAVNSRRWTAELGWNAAGYSEFLSDSVHYTAAGATMLASADASLMLHG